MLDTGSESQSPPNSVDCTDYFLMTASSPSKIDRYGTFQSSKGMRETPKNSSRTCPKNSVKIFITCDAIYIRSSCIAWFKNVNACEPTRLVNMCLLITEKK